jgi:thioredoxin-related protein
MRYLLLSLLSCLFFWTSLQAMPASESSFLHQPPYILADSISSTKTDNSPVILLFFTHTECALCAYMERVLFQDKQLADFYQTHFVSFRVPLESDIELVDLNQEKITTTALAERFAIEMNQLPVSIFLNAQGEVLSRFQGHTQRPEEYQWLGEWVLKPSDNREETFATYRQQRYRESAAENLLKAAEASHAFFDTTFGDLAEELSHVKEEQKAGILLFFEMENCPFCQRMRETALTAPEAQAFYRQHFKNFAIDILSDVELTDFDGTAMTQKEFAQQHRVRLTPVVIFYDAQGQTLYRHSGIITDSQEFIWLGEYVLTGEYKKDSFATFKQAKRHALSAQ